MKTLNHPTIPGVSVEVPTKSVKRWERSGWVAPATATKPSPSSDGANTTNQKPRDAANEKE